MTLIVDAQTIPLKADADGVMRVGDTRVTLDTVVHAFEQGHTAEEIVSHYPALRLADVYAVIAYYLNHRAEVQAYLLQQQEEAQKIWEQFETKVDYQAFRERLLARHKAKTSPSATAIDSNHL
jgi:uncharacterized protein (DUF433 family)